MIVYLDVEGNGEVRERGGKREGKRG